MIRSIISFCLAFVYLLLSLGAVAQIHYCGNNVSSIGLYKTEAATCACSIITQSDCCHEATIDFSFKTQTTVTVALKTPNPVEQVVFGFAEVPFSLQHINKEATPALSSWHPPQKLLLPLLATWRI